MYSSITTLYYMYSHVLVHADNKNTKKKNNATNWVCKIHITPNYENKQKHC